MADDFAADGQLAKAIPGFKPREPQRQMAHAVAHAIDKVQPLVVEAGTGTGKTYAYLAPALRAKKKVIISTGSKALQDQLYSRDLPTVAKALKYKGRLALLKGRSNYLCLERLEQQALAGGDLPVQTLSDVIILRAWANQTLDGDISTCASVAEDSAAWPLVTSTNDNCLGSDCPLYKDCFVVKARKTAMEADVVVVNHHLFLADMVVKESGFGELIPEAEVMIFDEAHQLPDIASQYFGQSLSSRQLLDLAKDFTIAYRTELKDTQQLQKCADRLAQSTQDFRLQLGDPGFRGNLRELLADNTIQRALLLLDDALELCYDVAKLSLGRSALLDAAFERATLYRARLKRLKEINQPGYSYWYECNSRHFTMALTPLTVADKFKEVMADKPGELDLHLRDPVGERRSAPLYRTSWHQRGGIAAAAKPVRLRDPGAALRPAQSAAAQSARRRAPSGGDAEADDRGQQRPLLYALYLPRDDARSGRAVPRNHDAAGAAAGRDQQRPAAAAVCQPRQRPAGGDQQLLGRGGRARRCPVAGDHR